MNQLLSSARTLGHAVRANIDSLYDELRSLTSKVTSEVTGESSKAAGADDEAERSPGDEALAKGVVQDRFTRQKVVITALSNFKPSMTSKEVQLPSMATLTSKTSSQSFLLRIPKVIIQRRDSIRSQDKKSSNRSNLRQDQEAAVQAAIDSLQQEAAAILNQSMCTSAVIAAATSSGLEAPEQQPFAPQQSMDMDAASNESNSTEPPVKQEPEVPETPAGVKEELLSDLLSLDDLWDSLSRCLLELADAPDHHAVLVLRPAVEAFFLVHVCEKDPSRSSRDARHESRENQLANINAEILQPASPLAIDQQDGGAGTSFEWKDSALLPDTQKFLQFAVTHKFVLNQILRQSTTPLVDGPFAVLVDHTRVLDFDVKRRYFRQELELVDGGFEKENVVVHVSDESLFEDSFRELRCRSADEWKNRFYIVFEGEERHNTCDLLREWYTIMSREIVNPLYALFCSPQEDHTTYRISIASRYYNTDYLLHFKFVGRVIAKVIYDNQQLECYFTRSIYKHILGKKMHFQDMESEDYALYRRLVFLLENDVCKLGEDLTFSLETDVLGDRDYHELKPGGRHIVVNEETKQEYVRLVCQHTLIGAIRRQLNAFLEGFYEIIPKRLISIFNEKELEQLISGSRPERGGQEFHELLTAVREEEESDLRKFTDEILKSHEWLCQLESAVTDRELGDNLESIDSLIKEHELFDRSLCAERNNLSFSTLIIQADRMTSARHHASSAIDYRLSALLDHKNRLMWQSRKRGDELRARQAEFQNHREPIGQKEEKTECEAGTNSFSFLIHGEGSGKETESGNQATRICSSETKSLYREVFGSSSSSDKSVTEREDDSNDTNSEEEDELSHDFLEPMATIKPSSPEERQDYHRQERQRYSNPEKAFTFHYRNQERTVGPVVPFRLKKLQRQIRDVSYLRSDRPAWLSSHSLVRDAGARLPDGRGSRGDICILVKDSQYLAPNLPDKELYRLVGRTLNHIQNLKSESSLKFEASQQLWHDTLGSRSEAEWEEATADLRETRAALMRKNCKTQGVERGKRKNRPRSVRELLSISRGPRPAISHPAVEPTAGPSGNQKAEHPLAATRSRFSRFTRLKESPGATQRRGQPMVMVTRLTPEDIAEIQRKLKKEKEDSGDEVEIIHDLTRSGRPARRVAHQTNNNLQRAIKHDMDSDREEGDDVQTGFEFKEFDRDSSGDVVLLREGVAEYEQAS